MEWSIVICTLNRFEVLRAALQTVVWQTVLPQQIIVVDASTDWETCRARALAEFGNAAPGVEWIYVGSDQRSLTRQRNIGLAHCRSGIIFFFDDDTFLYPDCAERILAVYRRDTDGQIGGVSAALRHTSPLEPAGSQSPSGLESVPERSYTGLTELLHSLWYPEQLFMPYDGQYHRREPAWAKGDRSLRVVPVFHGCRMTFRTQLVRDVGGCQEMLVRHAFGEDIDISYRVSQRSGLLVAQDAHVFHATAPGARAARVPQATLVMLNSSALYLLNGTDTRYRFARVLRFVMFRLLLETTRDVLKPWRGFPNVRGVMGAMRELPALAGIDGDELRRVYPLVQQRITDARKRA